jgi:NAD-dependent SIR2 family protein deacetylase
MIEKLRCWICGNLVTDEEYDHEAGQCKECEERNPMPICMRRDFVWPIFTC